MKELLSPELSQFFIKFPLLALPFVLAFSKRIRMEIGKRDGWECQHCDKKFSEGWMVYASHKPEHHHRLDPLYNDPSNGEILCIDCEQKRHEGGTSLGVQADRWAVEKLKRADRRTYKWRKQNGRNKK